jgi:signal transduction histidine kinase
MLAVSLAASAGAAWFVGLKVVREAERRQLERITEVTAVLRDGGFPLTPAVLERMARLSGADFALLRADGLLEPVTGGLAAEGLSADALIRAFESDPNTDGSTLASGSAPSRAASDSVGQDGPASFSTFVRLRIGQAEYLATRLGADRFGRRLHVLYPERSRIERRAEALEPVVTVGAVSSLLVIAVSLLVADRISRRVADAERRVRRIAEGDLGVAAPASGSDELARLLGSVDDLARQLADFRRRIGARERSQLLTQLSGGMAHHFRNAATGARLALDLHARRCPNGADSSLAMATRQLALMERQLRGLLALGDERPERRQPVDLAAAVTESVALLEPAARHTGTALVQRPPAGGRVRVDPDLLSASILNLLTNALEAAGPGGTVEIRVERAESPHSIGGGERRGDLTPAELDASAPLASGLLELTVADTGPGPPPELAGRLFEPFATGRPEGVGLGLHLVAGFAESSGGTITHERDGGRTLFRLRLPVDG